MAEAEVRVQAVQTSLDSVRSIARETLELIGQLDDRTRRAIEALKAYEARGAELSEAEIANERAIKRWLEHEALPDLRSRAALRPESEEARAILSVVPYIEAAARLPEELEAPQEPAERAPDQEHGVMPKASETPLPVHALTAVPEVPPPTPDTRARGESPESARPGAGRPERPPARPETEALAVDVPPPERHDAEVSRPERRGVEAEATRPERPGPAVDPPRAEALAAEVPPPERHGVEADLRERIEATPHPVRVEAPGLAIPDATVPGDETGGRDALPHPTSIRALRAEARALTHELERLTRAYENLRTQQSLGHRVNEEELAQLREQIWARREQLAQVEQRLAMMHSETAQHEGRLELIERLAHVIHRIEPLAPESLHPLMTTGATFLGGLAAGTPGLALLSAGGIGAALLYRAAERDHAAWVRALARSVAIARLRRPGRAPSHPPHIAATPVPHRPPTMPHVEPRHIEPRPERIPTRAAAVTPPVRAPSEQPVEERAPSLMERIFGRQRLQRWARRLGLAPRRPADLSPDEIREHIRWLERLAAEVPERAEDIPRVLPPGAPAHEIAAATEALMRARREGGDWPMVLPPPEALAAPFPAEATAHPPATEHAPEHGAPEGDLQDPLRRAHDLASRFGIWTPTEILQAERMLLQHIGPHAQLDVPLAIATVSDLDLQQWTNIAAQLAQRQRGLDQEALGRVFRVFTEAPIGPAPGVFATHAAQLATQIAHPLAGLDDPARVAQGLADMRQFLPAGIEPQTRLGLVAAEHMFGAFGRVLEQATGPFGDVIMRAIVALRDQPVAEELRARGIDIARPTGVFEARERARELMVEVPGFAEAMTRSMREMLPDEEVRRLALAQALGGDFTTARVLDQALERGMAQLFGRPAPPAQRRELIARAEETTHGTEFHALREALVRPELIQLAPDNMTMIMIGERLEKLQNDLSEYGRRWVRDSAYLFEALRQDWREMTQAMAERFEQALVTAE